MKPAPTKYRAVWIAADRRWAIPYDQCIGKPTGRMYDACRFVRSLNILNFRTIRHPVRWRT